MPSEALERGTYMKNVTKIVLALSVFLALSTIALAENNAGGDTAKAGFTAVNMAKLSPSADDTLNLGGHVFQHPALGINWINQKYTTSGDDNPDYAIEPNWGQPGGYAGAKF